ncbi:transcriptional regulator, TetR family [Pilibacter termitis]|uniref:Transcriptional regulator, TetR family n=1 Tax=Pilibacter termitis TaxID=263852 RepID=A0A1T4MAR3_9ENTE|nr:TetR/AcrR family transcriptional regulator [Pilibacter termitis]SJZ64042.1 transcriptional regulator, TetR family [Pilibacter termitis]
MVRKKVYTREQILKAATEIVEKEGFSNFTARSIAKYMGISTQPIYLEFKNMEELRFTVLDDLFTYLFDEVFPRKITGDPLIDIALNCIKFANANPQLFRALYIEENGAGNLLFEKSFYHYRTYIKNHPRGKGIDEQHIDALHIRTWIIVVGLATLTTSGIYKPTKGELIDMMNDVIKIILANPNPVCIS